MEFKVTKTVTVEEKINLENLRVLMTNSKDIDSTNFEVYNEEIEIAHGHLNNRTNWAHVTLSDELENQTDSHLLEDYLVTSIEARTITIQ